MSPAQKIAFLQYAFQMSTIAPVSVVNHYYINTLHLF